MSCNIIQLSGTRWDALGLLRKARKPRSHFTNQFLLRLQAGPAVFAETLSSPEPTPCPPVGPTRVQGPAFKSVVLLEEARPGFTTKKKRRRKNQRARQLDETFVGQI